MDLDAEHRPLVTPFEAGVHEFPVHRRHPGGVPAAPLILVHDR